MIWKIIGVTVAAWFLGVWGWCQIIGSLQNVWYNKRLIFTLVLWLCIMGVGAYVAIAVLDCLWALVIGYVLSLLQALRAGKIE